MPIILRGYKYFFKIYKRLCIYSITKTQVNVARYINASLYTITITQVNLEKYINASVSIILSRGYKYFFKIFINAFVSTITITQVNVERYINASVSITRSIILLPGDKYFFKHIFSYSTDGVGYFVGSYDVDKDNYDTRDDILWQGFKQTEGRCIHL